MLQPGSVHECSIQRSKQIRVGDLHWRGSPAAVRREALKRDPDAIGLESPQAWVLTRTLVDPYQNRDGGPSPASPYLDHRLQPSLALQASQQVNEAFSLIVHPSSEGDGQQIPLSPVRDSEIASRAAGFFSQLNDALNSNGLRLCHRGTRQGELGSSESWWIKWRC